VKVKLSGVNITSNNVAVKLELSWHAFKDFDSINRIAVVCEMKVRKEAKKTNGVDNNVGRILKNNVY
jgi:hypothetical protein